MMKSMMLSILILAVEIQAQDRTPTGFVYPTGTANLKVFAGFLALGCNGASDYPAGDYHLGADIAANVGTSVYAISDGTVVVKSYNGWEAGNVGLLIKHTLANGTDFYAVYGHIHTTLNSGDAVTAGMVIGTVGVVSTGDHLHFGLHPGIDIPSTNWGRIACSLWPDTNGLVEPLSWINNQHPKVNSISSNLNDVAKTELINRAARDSRFGAPVNGNLGFNPNWDPNWELRWLDFTFNSTATRSNMVVTIYHATNKQNPASRYVEFFDPDTNTWNGWTAAY